MSWPKRANGDIDLTSAWQGDNAGATRRARDGRRRAAALAAAADRAQRRTARRSPARCSAASSTARSRLAAADRADQPGALQAGRAWTRASRAWCAHARIHARRGVGETEIPASDWAWARCDAGNPFPGTPDPTQVCLKGGFDAAKLYQVVYTSAEPYALGIGFAAWRDVGMFFKTARADDAGTANPVAGMVTHSIARGVSQSGNFLRGWLHLGFNRDEAGQQVHDGLWPIIAGRASH
jgi:hypothetical protein